MPQHRSSSNGDLLTTEQAALVLDVAPQTLANWRLTKRYPLDYVQIGRKVRYRRCDLDTFIESRRASVLAAREVDAA